jgi:hypothetical protein
VLSMRMRAMVSDYLFINTTIYIYSPCNFCTILSMVLLSGVCNLICDLQILEGGLAMVMSGRHGCRKILLFCGWASVSFFREGRIGEKSKHEQSRTFITLGTNFLTLETCSLTSHPGIYIEHSCSSDVTIDENRLYSDCNNSSTSPKFHTDTKRVRFHIQSLIPGHNATVLRLYSDDKESF